MEGSVTVGVVTHLRKTNERLSARHGRCAVNPVVTSSHRWIGWGSWRTRSFPRSSRRAPSPTRSRFSSLPRPTSRCGRLARAISPRWSSSAAILIRWTTVPTPPDGYGLRDAEEFLALTAAGWTSGQRLGWTIEARRDGWRGFCGSIDLRMEGDGIAEVGFGLHPAARGRSIMTAALQLSVITASRSPGSR